MLYVLHIFSALMLLVGRQEWLDAGVVMCLGQDADLHMAQMMHCHSMSLLLYLSATGSLG